MKREAQPMLSGDGQYALDQYRQDLQSLEDLSPVTIRNYLSDLRQFMAWCEYSWREYSWREEQDEQPFTPQAVAPPCSSATGPICKRPSGSSPPRSIAHS